MSAVESVEAILSQNAQRVRYAVRRAAARAGRAENDIHVVAVTKSIDTGVMTRLLPLGFSDFGENRVQQLLERVALLGGSLRSLSSETSAPMAPPSPRWHMIGHIQRNKVRALLRSVRVIHSLDSIRLAEEFERQLATADAEACLEAFLEVNVSGETAKGGVSVDEAAALAEFVSRSTRIRLVGLMTMAPFSSRPEDSRPIFAELRRLREALLQSGAAPPTCTELSMGMSNDFPIAIEEGATWVRIGSELFAGIRSSKEPGE